MLDTIIIGAGIAGLTASIYASRKKMDFLLISEQFGGQFLESGEILNYPGITETSGAEFSLKMQKQIAYNNVTPALGEKVIEIKKAENSFFVLTDKNRYESKTVIIATGSKPKKLNISGEKEFKNKGVAYCSVCDGPLFNGKDIAIVGGGNSALEGVDFTWKIAKKIYLINISDEFNAHEYLIDRIKSYKNVEIITGAVTKEISGDKFVTGLKYEKDGAMHGIKVQGIIVEIGRMPNTSFVKNTLELDEHGHIKIDCQSRTSVEGIFAAGDCASGHEYQYTIAAGQGCIALLKCARYLAGKNQ